MAYGLNPELPCELTAFREASHRISRMLSITLGSKKVRRELARLDNICSNLTMRAGMKQNQATLESTVRNIAKFGGSFPHSRTPEAETAKRGRSHVPAGS